MNRGDILFTKEAIIELAKEHYTDEIDLVECSEIKWYGDLAYVYLQKEGVSQRALVIMNSRTGEIAQPYPV